MLAFVTGIAGTGNESALEFQVYIRKYYMKFSILRTGQHARGPKFLVTYFIQPPRPAPRSMTALPFPSTTCSPSIRKIPFDILAHLFFGCRPGTGRACCSKRVRCEFVILENMNEAGKVAEVALPRVFVLHRWRLNVVTSRKMGA